MSKYKVGDKFSKGKATIKIVSCHGDKYSNLYYRGYNISAGGITESELDNLQKIGS